MYSSTVIRAAVEFCYSDEIVSGNKILETTEEAGRELVHLAHFAEFYQIPKLTQRVYMLGLKVMRKTPAYASAIFKEATVIKLESNALRSDAWENMLRNPATFFQFIESEENRRLLDASQFRALVLDVYNKTRENNNDYYEPAWVQEAKKMSEM
mmetsp:Transcript_8699/g.15987  ORF Transcript_8699/g.15987 Transcript_8699/m.15987 type:complete len:154 (-) Transcript_8699:103-564(-)